MRPSASSQLLRGLAVAALSVVAPVDGAAQTLDVLTVAAPAALLPAPYADPEAAVRSLSEMAERAPGDVDLRLALAREATALGLLETAKEDRVAWLVRAEEAARAALAIDSARADTNYWLAASVGLRADEEGGRTKISLAREAYARAMRTLELDSLHPGAHHIVGRLHAGAKRLGWFNRLIARGLGLGAILEEASWESAERHMRTAAERQPDDLVNRYELGKLLLERRLAPTEGAAILGDLAGLAPRHRLDSLYIDKARRALSELGAERQ
jgi:hypothetical protein